jgi:hypothetical protein
MKKYLAAFIAISVLISCNSGNEEKTDNSADSTSHTDMHSPTTVEMPALPEVPADAKVFFANLRDGQTVSSPVKIEMGVMGMSLDTANGIIKPASGHHHILIGLDSITTGTVVPKDSVHLHYGNAQSNAEINLPPGKHTLTLQFADALHRSYGARLTSKVMINVKQ